MGFKSASLTRITSNKQAKESPFIMPRTTPHPGAFLRKDVMPSLNISQGEMAADLHISKATLSRLLAERISLSAGMAVRLGKYLGNGAEFWMSLQMQYELAEARKKLVRILPSIKTVKTFSRLKR